MNKGKKIKQNHNVPNPWDSVKVYRGKLTGMLTDKLANALFPAGTVKFNSNGLTPVVLKEGGRKIFK